MVANDRVRPNTAAAVFAALLIGGIAFNAFGATLQVDSTADTPDTAGAATVCGTVPNACTLRAALQQAAENADASNTITFADGVNGGTTTANVNGDYPVITKPLTITGPASRFTVNGNAANSLFRSTGAAGSYSISDLVITNARGDAVAPATTNGGGGIFFNPSSASTLTLSNVDITNNRAVSTGGAPGGGLYVGAGHTATVTSGLIDGNNTAGDTSPAGSNGGGIFNAGVLEVSGTMISDNVAAQGGGIFNSGTLTLSKQVATLASLVTNTASGLGGGGIYNFNGALTATDTVLDGNQASGGSAVGGGGLYSEIDTGGATTLTRVTIKNGTVAGGGNGGGIYARKVVSSADFSLTDSTLDNNTASGGAGGGLFVKRGLVQITTSTLSNNTAASSGGGIYLDVDGSGGRVAISNGTISGNSAVVGGGIGVNKNNVSTSNMVHVTLAENEASDASGAGGISYGLPADGALNPNLVFPGTFGNAFTSNMIVKNTANAVLQNCRDPFTHSNANDSGYNVTDDASCGLTQSTDRSVTPPAPLGMLADNLGSTQTHGVMAGNPAIDHANPLYVTTADQRGAPAQDGDQSGEAIRDAGAYEYGGFGVMHFDQSAYTVREDAASLTAVVKRFGNSDTMTSVKVSTANGTATAPADYVSLSSQNVPFAATDVSEDVIVTINDDDVFPETGEQFSVLLSAPQKGSDLGPRDAAAVTITDVEEGAFQFAQAAYSASEGGTAAVNENGTVTITVTRASGSDKAVTVSYSVTGGTAVAAEDYVAASATGSLSWTDGDSAWKTFDVQLIDDIKDETGGAATRTLELTLADPPGRARLGTPVTTTLTLTDDDATPQVTLAVNPGTFNETGGIATVTATLVGSTSTSDATVNLAFSGTANRDASCGAAQNPADYTCSGNVLTIPAGETSASMALTGITDAENESDESVIVDIASTSANVAEQGTQQVNATIAEVAAIRGDLSLSSATYTAMEASGSLAVTVTRANGDDGAATVQCVAENGTAVAGDDFNATPSPATLNWADNETGDRVCTFTLVNDTFRESNKTFTVKLANATGAGLGAISQAAATLISDEQPRFQFNLTSTQVQEGVMGFQVSVEALEAVDGEPVTIGFFTADGTAMASSMDYTATSGSFTWSNGDGSTKTFSVAMIGADGVIEGNETFTVNLGVPVGGGQVVANNPTTVTIVDPPAVRFKAAVFSSVDEQDGGVIQVCVERIGSQQGAVSVEYDVTGGAATENVDYTPPPGTPMRVLSWANNDTADKCFDITIIGDTIDESDETIALELLNQSAGLSIDSPNPAQATITDDDAAPKVSLSATPASIAEEGGGNSATLTATLNGTTTTADVVVNLVYSGAAVNGTDYTGAAVITVPAGQTSVSITLTAVADAIDEGGGEELAATIDSVSANAKIGAPSTASTAITDNDAVTVSFAVDSQTVTEGTGAGTTTVTVTATRTGATTAAVNVPFSVSGTAVNPDDHDAVGGGLGFPASNNASEVATVSFTVVRDGIDESDESVVLALGAPSGGDISTAAPTVHTVTVQDDDEPSYMIDDAAVTEGNSGTVTATFTVTRTNSDEATTVDFTTAGGTATEGTDFQHATGTLNFAVSATSSTQTITVTVNGDFIDETNETYSVTLSNASGGSIADDTGAGTITDDDTADVTITQSGGSTAVAEGGATDTYTMVLTSQPTADVTITVTGDADVSGNPSPLTFTSVNWNVAQTIAVTAVNDAIAEGAHSGTLTHSAASSDTSYNGISIASVAASITDNDTAGILVTESGGSTAVAEGGATDTLTVVLTAQPTANVTITAAPGSQLTATPATLTFTPANFSTPQTVTVGAVDDQQAEGAHSGTLGGTASSADAAYNGNLGTLTVAITDNDTVGMVVTQSGGNTRVTEGGATDAFTVVLTSQPAANVTIALSAGSQLTLSPASLTFTPSNFGTAQTVTVRAANDDQAEGTHSGTVNVSSSSTDAGYNGRTATVTATITDNDEVAGGDDAPGIVVTVNGGSVNVGSNQSEGGGALSHGGLLGLLGLLALRRRKSLVTAALAVAALGSGATSAAELSYRYGDLRYIAVDADPDVSASGFSLAGSLLVKPTVFLTGSYAQADTDDFAVQGVSGSVKSSSLSAGVGMRRALDQKVDATGSLSLVYAKADGEGGFSGGSNDTGFALEAGLRGWFAPKFEWGAAVNYLSIFDDGSTALNTQGLYHFTPKFAAAAGAGFSDNATQFNLGARFAF